MASKVSVQCFIQQETGFLIDELGTKLHAKSMVMCKSIPYVVTEEGDIDHFVGGTMENIYHTDDRYSGILERQVKKLKAEKSQSFLGNMLRVLTGSRSRTRCRQLTGIRPYVSLLRFTPCYRYRGTSYCDTTSPKQDGMNLANTVSSSTIGRGPNAARH